MLTAIAKGQAGRNGHASSGRVARTGIRRNTQAAGARVPDPEQRVLDWLDLQLLDACRRDFPVCEKPFAEIARRLDRSAGEVLRHFQELERCGVVNRVGPVPAPESAGASTLVAMAVPQARLRSIAEAVTAYRGVDRMWERQHEFNLWFALAAPSAGELYDTVAEIRRRTGVEVLDLRPERRYCGDLELPPLRRTSSGRGCVSSETYPPGRHPPLDASDGRLLAALREGLSFTAHPYAAVAKRAGISEAQATERLKRLLREGVIERMGVVERHPRGHAANALVVFDVARHRVDMVGERLAETAWVDHCYRCLQRAPVWPYNLYCTLHDDRDLAELIGWVDVEVFGVVRCPRRAVLLGRASGSEEVN